MARNFSGKNLFGVDLSRQDLVGADFSFAILHNVSLSRSDLTGATMRGADLSGASLTRAKMTDVGFTEANLTDAKCMGADLTGCDLRRANLSRADLTDANLYAANLTAANLKGANLTGANLTGAIVIGAIGLDRTGAIFKPVVSGSTTPRQNSAEMNPRQSLPLTQSNPRAKPRSQELMQKELVERASQESETAEIIAQFKRPEHRMSLDQQITRIKDLVHKFCQALEEGGETNSVRLGLTPTDLAQVITSPDSDEQERAETIEVTLHFRTAKVVEIATFYSTGKAKRLEWSAISDLDEIAKRNVEAKAIMDKWRGEVYGSDLDTVPEKEGDTNVLDVTGVDPEVLHWEVLPTGWWNDAEYDSVSLLLGTREQQKLLVDRLRFISTLGTSECFVGNDEFGQRQYYVFVFASHVVAECPLEGNAIYVLVGTDDWQNILQQSKSMVRKIGGDRLKVITHRGEWKSRLKQVLDL